MSTPEPVGVTAQRLAERRLFRALFDDAAVFPPGLAPLPRALSDHCARQSSSDADLVGPLLLPPSSVADLLTLEHPHLQVALVARPGTSLALVNEALSRLSERSAVTLTGVEVGWSADWHQALGWGAQASGVSRAGSVLSIEVPGGGSADLERALSDIRAHTDDANPVQAKFRTGSTPERPAPTPTELATFIRACVDHDLSFKLTGGLHGAISARTPEGEDQLGFLNVIAATRWALAHGAETPEMESLLSQHDPGPILEIITRMSEADASVLRAFFTSYGCCGVIDPIGDLAALGLIEETSV
jgi:hypothetical protein